MGNNTKSSGLASSEIAEQPVKINMSDKQNAKFTASVRGMMAGLVVEFLLGLATGTFAGYQPNPSPSHHIVHEIFVDLHIVVGLGILVNAILLVAAARHQTKPVRTSAAIGFAAILLAIIFGFLTMNLAPHTLFSFLMGAAFITYGTLAGRQTFAAEA
jgi:magnesium-transporting ATPase (P-type)